MIDNYRATRIATAAWKMRDAFGIMPPYAVSLCAEEFGMKCAEPLDGLDVRWFPALVGYIRRNAEDAIVADPAAAAQAEREATRAAAAAERAEYDALNAAEDAERDRFYGVSP